MMRFVILLSVFCSTPVFAEPATFYLNDGSTVVGEVHSLKNGTYLIEGESLGRIEIPQKNVQRVQYGETSGVASNGQLTSQPSLDVDALGMTMLANPAILSIIQTLKNDPQFQAVATDPEIQRAISSGDYLSLMANPKIIQLMNHSMVKAISEEIQR